MPATNEIKIVGDTRASDGAAQQGMNDADDGYHAALSLIAHELRSPASVVSGYLRMLLQSELSGLTDRQRHLIEQAGVGCGRMLRLIQELGDLAALESSEPIRALGVSVFSLCEEAMEAAGNDTRSIPIFTCRAADRAIAVEGDAGGLKRAFGALVAATARAHGTDQLECYGFVHGAAECRNAVIACGLPGLEARRNDIVANRTAFDRWRGGSGLSLPIACRIIEAHGGSVWAAGPGDSRATCVWSLPIATSPPPKA
jgi:signal transduction histidine kinase